MKNIKDLLNEWQENQTAKIRLKNVRTRLNDFKSTLDVTIKEETIYITSCGTALSSFSGKDTVEKICKRFNEIISAAEDCAAESKIKISKK